MSRAAIYTVNQTPQEVADGGTINLGSVIRRFGCNLGLSGNAILVDGAGYYAFDVNVTLVPADAGEVTVTLMRNGVELPGATASAEGTAGDPVNLSVSNMLKEGCCCDGASNITCILTGASTVTNIAVRGERL